MACFVGEGTCRTVRVCASPAGRKVAVQARYSDSDQKIRSASTAPERAMFAALRAVMLACDPAHR